MASASSWPHPELAHQHAFALAIGTLYGAFSGVFAARGIRLWMLATRQDLQRQAGAAASVQ